MLYSARQWCFLPAAAMSSELTITARPTPNAAPARLNVHKSIDSPSAQELSDFRRAVKHALALNDKRALIIIASWHGVPFGWCRPWWDWSKDGAIPAAYANAQADGTENVLAKAPVKAFNIRRYRWRAPVRATDAAHLCISRSRVRQVSAPPPGAADASASSPGARRPGATAPAGVLPGLPGDEGPARRERAPTSARGRTGG